jgi:ubiquinone/menaquinone biosynthesis C-methylase UbiE
MFLLTFGAKLFTAPIPKDQLLHRVLDVGTGTGIWAIDFGKNLLPTHCVANRHTADEYPQTQVKVKLLSVKCQR